MSKPRKPKARPGHDPVLRAAAEAQVARARSRARPLAGKTTQGIIHKLQVHEVELELQNEELKQARQALEESRDRYLDLYDFGPVGYFTFTREGRILEVNLTGAVLLGVPRARLIGRGLGSFVVREDRGQWEGHLRGVLGSAGPSPGPGGKQGCELQLRRGGGSNFHARLESVRLERGCWPESAGAGGDEVIIRTAMSDITERVRAQRASEEAHARVATVLESITEAFFSLDREWRFTYVNQEAVRILGFTREQLVGQGIWELFPQAAGSRFQREYERAVARNETAHFEEFYAPFGIWFEIYAYPSTAGLAVYFHDITARRNNEATLRESEEQLRLVLEQSSDAIFWADAETGVLVRCNRKAEELTERTREELIGMHQKHLHPPDRDYGAVFRQAAAKPAAKDIEAEVVSRTGRRTPVVINSSVVTLGQKRIIQGIFRDMTERQRAEERTKAALEQRRLALEAAGMGSWEYRFDIGEVFWDERCRDQWGIAQGGQIAYAATIAAIHPDERVAVDEAVKRALAGRDGGAFHREFRVVWPDGSAHWLSSRGQVYFEGEGARRRAVRFVGANRDITERKRLEEAQEFVARCGYEASSEHFFQALARFLAQSLGMDFVCIDRLPGDGLAAQTVAIYSDGKFEDNVTYALKDTPCGELVGKRICCFPRAVRQRFPKDRVLQELKAESYVGTTLWSFDGKPIGLIAVIGRRPLADGRLAESVLELVAVRAAGELQRAQAAAVLRRAYEELDRRVQERTAELQQANEQLRQEIAVRRQTEQELTVAEFRYRTVAEFTHDWEYWKTQEGVLLYCSPSCERITGYTSAELTVSTELLVQMVDPEDRDRWRQHDCEALAAPERRSITFRIHRKDGAVRWIEHFCQPVIGLEGEFLGVRASNRDITDRKEEEMQIQQLREELARVARVTTAGQLTASLAHELNQPLTAIRCNAETAQQFLAATPPNVAELRDTLADIAHDSERAGAVIQRLRALFNKSAPDQSAVQLNDIINDTLELLRSEFVLKGIAAQVHLEPALPQVLGNRIELQQVVLNLVVNAIEALSQRETGQRRLQIVTGCEGPGEIGAWFCDSGAGIRVQPMSRLFEPFFTTKAGGMGMGLAISRSIIEAHGGRLGAANNPEQGATFQIALPIYHQAKA